MSTSLKDIAQTLNISKTTVSWILAGKGKERRISQTTIDRVMSYVEKINYQPNLLARGLSLGFTNTIGLVIPAIGDTFYSQMAYAIENEAKKYNYILTICSSEGDGEQEHNIINALKAKQVDGLIIVPTKKSTLGILNLIKTNFPFVLIDRYFPELKTNYIIVDNEHSSKQLVSHLIEKGSKKVALITSDIHLLVMQLRMKGYYSALNEAKFSPEPSLVKVISRDKYIDGVVGALDELFTDVPDVDGFYFATHYLAIEAIRYFVSRNIDYKNKFNLACFHDTIALDILAPKMTISRMPIEEMSKQAVEVLLQSIKVSTTVQKEIILKNTLVIND